MKIRCDNSSKISNVVRNLADADTRTGTKQNRIKFSFGKTNYRLIG